MYSSPFSYLLTFCFSSALAAAIATKGSALEILDIANNIIETEGVLELCAGLRANTSLKTVCLRQNIFEIRGEIALQEVN